MTTRPGPTRVTDHEPLPCPFCGSATAPAVIPANGPNAYVVACMPGGGGCGSDSGVKRTREEALVLWNRRSTPPDPRDALLREAITVLGYFPTHPDTQPLCERIDAAIGDKEESNRD